jgi:hypothetical protein
MGGPLEVTHPGRTSILDEVVSLHAEPGVFLASPRFFSTGQEIERVDAWTAIPVGFYIHRIQL